MSKPRITITLDADVALSIGTTLVSADVRVCDAAREQLTEIGTAFVRAARKSITQAAYAQAGKAAS